MKAALLSEVGKLSIIEKPVPTIGPDEVLVKVKYCGICGSDIHSYQSGLLYPVGTVMGHEFTAVIDKIGSRVTEHKPGDRVVILPAAPCRKCDCCKRGMDNLCLHGFDRDVGESPERDGGYAQYVRIPWPDEMLCKLPDNVSFEEGTLVDPLATSFHAVRQSRFKPGDQVVVLGAGPIGLGAIEFLKMGGAGKIIAVEIATARAAAAKTMGADVVLNPVDKGEQLAQRVSDLTRGLGADIVYECTGVPAAFENSVNLVKSGGQVMVVGVIENNTPISPLTILIKEVEIKGCLAYTSDEFQMVIDFLGAGRIDTDAFISDTISLEDIEAQGFNRLISGSDAIKILVSP